MERKTRIAVTALSIMAAVGLAFGVGRVIGSNSASNSASEVAPSSAPDHSTYESDYLRPIVGTWEGTGTIPRGTTQLKLTIDEHGAVSGSCTGTTEADLEDLGRYWIALDCGGVEIRAAGDLSLDHNALRLHTIDGGESNLAPTSSPFGDMTK